MKVKISELVFVLQGIAEQFGDAEVAVLRTEIYPSHIRDREFSVDRMHMSAGNEKLLIDTGYEICLGAVK